MVAAGIYFLIRVQFLIAADVLNTIMTRRRRHYTLAYVL